MSGMFGSYNNRNTNNDEDLDLFNNQANNRVATARNKFTNSIVLAILLLFISLLLYKFGKIGEIEFFYSISNNRGIEFYRLYKFTSISSFRDLLYARFNNFIMSYLFMYKID